MSVFSGDRRDPSGRGVLSGPGPVQHSAQDPSGWDPSFRDQAALPGGSAPPLQCPNVPSHLCHQLAQTAAETARYTTHLQLSTVPNNVYNWFSICSATLNRKHFRMCTLTVSLK